MGIEVAFRQFHGFAYHYSQRDAGQFQLVGYLQRLADEVSVMYKGLYRQPGIVGLDVPFALCPGTDNHTRAVRGARHFHRLADRAYERLAGERLHDTRRTDDG